jgi:hypothetical protein
LVEGFDELRRDPQDLDERSPNTCVAQIEVKPKEAAGFEQLVRLGLEVAQALLKCDAASG